MIEGPAIRVVPLQSERAQRIHADLEGRAARILDGVRRDVMELELRPDERVEALVALASLEWGMARDVLEAALGAEREEQRLRADVAATALLAQGDQE